MSPNPTLPYLYLFSKQKFFSKSVLLKISGNCLLSASELTSLCQMLVPKKYQAFVSCSVSVMATESFQPLSLGIVGECVQFFFFWFLGRQGPFMLPSVDLFARSSAHPQNFLLFLLSPDSSPSIAPPCQPCHFCHLCWPVITPRALQDQDSISRTKPICSCFSP